MILLDDGEILRALNKERNYPLHEVDSDDRAIARAAVGKVVEWGEELCSHAGPVDDDPIREKKHCNACWQALKKEIE